ARPKVSRAGLFDLPRGWKKIQINAASPDTTWTDARTVSREMEPAVRLSHGCAQLRGSAIGYGEKDRTGSKTEKGWLTAPLQVRQVAYGGRGAFRLGADHKGPA